MENFSKNYTTNLADLGIKKMKAGKFEYLSWSHCQKVMKELDPKSHYTMIYNTNNDSFIWGGFVRVQMFFGGKTVEHAYPVLDANNNGVIKTEGVWKFVTKPSKKSPNAIIKEEVSSFDINNAQMRGFAKLFSMETGIGLSIFTGEDIEQYQTIEEYSKDKKENDELQKVKNEFNEYYKRYKKTIDESGNIFDGLDSKNMEKNEWVDLLKKCKNLVEKNRDLKQENINQNTIDEVNKLFGWQKNEN